MEEKNPFGRPTIYTQELADEICDTVACTPHMLEELCKQNPGWPAAKTIYQWRNRRPDFGKEYACAKQSQIESLLSDLMCKVRNKEDDFYENKDGSLLVNTAAMQRLRIEVDAIKWFASKLAPKIYGNKLTIENSDEEKDSLEKAKAIANAMKGDI